MFDILNQYPGGGPRTPGYWKNWNRVTGGGQADNADRNGGWENGFWLLEDVLDPNVGGGIWWDDILDDGGDPDPPYTSPINNAAVAVDILDQREIGDPDVVGDGVKHSSDAAYTLAMHLLAAQLNFGAGAETCQAALDAALAAEELLDKYDFNGTGDYLLSKYKDRTRNDGTGVWDKADYALALELATQLDLYNNGELCDGETAPPPVDSPDDPPTVSITSPANGDVLGALGNVPNPISITADASDDNSVTQVEFQVINSDNVPEVIFVDTDDSDGWSAINDGWDSTGVADGDYTITATATDTIGQTGSDSIGVTVDNVPDVDPPVLGTLYVYDLDATAAPGKRGKWDATVTITIYSDAGSMVDFAVVSGTWSDGTIDSCETDGSGQCPITLSNINTRNTDSVTFTVDDVSAIDYVYDPGLNNETTISIASP